MIDLGNRIIHDDGTVVCKQDAIIELLYAGHDVSNVLCDNLDDDVEWKHANKICDTTIQGLTYVDAPIYNDVDWFQYWLTPEPYASIDLKEWSLSKCKTQQEIDRVLLEVDELQNRNMVPVMRHLIYCVDVWRKHNMFWGVGRGSSVCSFVLYLIGINRINPLEYDLDLKEWLK